MIVRSQEMCFNGDRMIRMASLRFFEVEKHLNFDSSFKKKRFP